MRAALNTAGASLSLGADGEWCVATSPRPSASPSPLGSRRPAPFVADERLLAVKCEGLGGKNARESGALVTPERRKANRSLGLPETYVPPKRPPG